MENCNVLDRLRHLQWVDLFSEGGYDRLFRALKKRESERYQKGWDRSTSNVSMNKMKSSKALSLLDTVALKGPNSTAQFLAKLKKYKEGVITLDFLESVKEIFYFTLWDPADPWEDVDDYLSSLKIKGLIQIEGEKISITQKGKDYIQAHNI